MDKPDRILRTEIEAVVKKYDNREASVMSRLRVRDRLTEWAGRGEAQWNPPSMSTILAALGAVDSFVTIDSRIAPKYDRVMYGLACADEYFRERRKPPLPLRPKGQIFGSLALWMPRLSGDPTPEEVDRKDLPSPYTSPKASVPGIKMIPPSI